MHDYVHEDFLERELEWHRLGGRQLGGRPELLQEPRQHRQLRRMARNADALLDHAGLCGSDARAAARSGCRAITRVNPLSSNTSRTAGCSEHIANLMPARCEARAANRNTRSPALDTYSSPVQ